MYEVCYIYSTFNNLFKKLVPNPSFEAGEISRFDFGQGIVGKQIAKFLIICKLLVQKCHFDERVQKRFQYNQSSVI